jgi:transposase
MDHYAGLDVSLKLTSVCVVDEKGKIVRETKVESEPGALIGFFAELGLPMVRIGLEAGPLSQHLHAGLTEGGLDAVLLETRHVKAALSAMTVKTDRKDARGIAQLLRMGWFRPVHCKSMAAQETRALLTARKVLLGKLIDTEMSVRGILRGFGLKVGPTTKKTFADRVRVLVAGQATLERVIDPMLRCHAALRTEFAGLHRQLLAAVRGDAVCKRLMTAPGVGPVAALTFMATVDDPARFASSRSVGPHFGLTPRKYQSGETDVTGGITKAGDAMVRSALYEAAMSMLVRSQRMSALKAWAMQVARRRGLKRAVVALARKLATVLHRMWVDGTEFRWTREAPAVPAAA